MPSSQILQCKKRPKTRHQSHPQAFWIWTNIWKNMTPNALKQGKFSSFGGHIFVHVFALHVGVGVAKQSPIKAKLFTPPLKNITHSLQIYPYPMVWPRIETMVWDHGLNPPLSTENPRNEGIFWVWSAHFWIWSHRPRAQGVGVDPFCWITYMKKFWAN